MGKTAPEFEDTIPICSCNHEPAVTYQNRKPPKQFKVYTNPQGDYEAAEPGWSRNACGFGPFWALSKKMWTLGVGVLIALFAIWGIAVVTCPL
jgi:hypothetical protein